MPNVAIISNTENKGFAAAANQGIRAAGTDICLILNPDAVACQNAVLKLGQLLALEHVGAVGGALSRQGLPEKGFVIRRFPNLLTATCEILLVNQLWPGNPWNRRYRYLDFDYHTVQEVEQPAGACLAVNRRAWQEIGGFDESFFPVWFEDVDFCRRLRDRGWKILYCPEAIFLHEGGHSVSKLSFAQRQSYWYENQLRYFAKHHSRTETTALRAVIMVGLLLRSVLSILGLRSNAISLKDNLVAYAQAAWHCAVLGRGMESKTKSMVAGPLA